MVAGVDQISKAGDERAVGLDEHHGGVGVDRLLEVEGLWGVRLGEWNRGAACWLAVPRFITMVRAPGPAMRMPVRSSMGTNSTSSMMMKWSRRVARVAGEAV